MCWQGKVHADQLTAVVSAQVACALMQKGNNAVTSAGIRTACVGIGTVKAEDIAWLGKPNVPITGHEFTSVKVAKETNQRQAHIVFVAMYLSDRVGIHLQRAPNDAVLERKQP